MVEDVDHILISRQGCAKPLSDWIHAGGVVDRIRAVPESLARRTLVGMTYPPKDYDRGEVIHNGMH